MKIVQSGSVWTFDPKEQKASRFDVNGEGWSLVVATSSEGQIRPAIRFHSQWANVDTTTLVLETLSDVAEHVPQKFHDDCVELFGF